MALNFTQTPAIGVSIPIKKGNTGYFAQTFSIQDEIKSNLVNLLMTRKGERVFQPTFGCDIQTIIFDPMDADFETSISNAIKSAVSFWMPFLNITSVSVSRDDNRQITYANVSFALKSNAIITDTIIVSF